MATARRGVTKLRLDPAGDEAPGAIREFCLVKITSHEYRAREGGRWTADPDRVLDDREVLAGLTRRQAAELAADIVDWLSYIEEG